MNRRRWRVLLAVVTAGLAGGLAYYAGLLRFNYPSAERFPVRGIDVSHHQGHISWYTAGLNEVKFAYIKASEGADFRDRRFTYNWEQSRLNGIARGAYHFFSFCQPGAAQARNFLRTVPYDARDLMPALDLEFSGNCGRTPSRAEMAREISRFVSAISSRLKNPPVFYADQNFYKRYLAGHRHEFPPHQLWIRNTLREPTQKPCEEWTYWQYGSRGRIPGIPGPVDLNVYCGTPEQFSNLEHLLPRPKEALH